VHVPAHLEFFLVAGSDARPGEDIGRTRADSIHVVAVDPHTRRGTVLGLPRDSYVNIPGHRAGKINSALAIGGPKLLVATVRELTGFPISYYALTGFDGMVHMVDTLGGLDVYVSEPMNDRFSGARFERGWHHMDGRQVLAFTRNRQVSGGDFTRSANQGKVILHALDKLRAETSDEAGVRRWVDVLFGAARLDMGAADALRLGTFARQLPSTDLRNVVASGRVAYRGSQSVVVLDDAAYALFRDVGADAVADGREATVTPSPSRSSSPTPAPVPAPTATPAGPVATPSPTPRPAASPTPTGSPILPMP
jgi:LCP family protein required for cell wall assembly